MFIFNGKLYTSDKPKFGRLTVLKLDSLDKWKHRVWLCGCLCGNFTKVENSNLLRAGNNTRSCNNCRDLEKYPKEALAYRNIHVRCYSEKDEHYKDYGGRGIKISAHWRKDFFNFLIDVGLAPTDWHSLDRINNDGDYEAGNVKWSTPDQQAFNRRPRRTTYKILTINHR